MRFSALLIKIWSVVVFFVAYNHTRLIFFSITTGQISTIIDTKHSWRKCLEICSNNFKGQVPFKGGIKIYLTFVSIIKNQKICNLRGSADSNFFKSWLMVVELATKRRLVWNFYYRINREKIILGNKYNFQKLKHQKELNVYM